MTHVIKVHKKEQYLSVVTDGVVDVRYLTGMGKEFVQKERETGIRRVLIDIRKSRIKANLIDAFTYTSNSSIPILPGEKNAVLILPKSPDAIKARIYSLQSMFSGLHVRVFEDEAEAMEWLLL